MSPKTKLKSFFKAGEGSESAVELLTHFILPFSRGMKKSGVDDVIAAFFGVDERGFFYCKAKRTFEMPGGYFIAGDRPVQGLKVPQRHIKRGQVMLVAVDRETSTARIDVGHVDNSATFSLQKFEFETIKDWLDVIE
jgi:hypothetical protein